MPKNGNVASRPQSKKTDTPLFNIKELENKTVRVTINPDVVKDMNEKMFNYELQRVAKNNIVSELDLSKCTFSKNLGAINSFIRDTVSLEALIMTDDILVPERISILKNLDKNKHLTRLDLHNSLMPQKEQENALTGAFTQIQKLILENPFTEINLSGGKWPAFYATLIAEAFADLDRAQLFPNKSRYILDLSNTNLKNEEKARIEDLIQQVWDDHKTTVTIKYGSQKETIEPYYSKSYWSSSSESDDISLSSRENDRQTAYEGQGTKSDLELSMLEYNDVQNADQGRDTEHSELGIEQKGFNFLNDQAGFTSDSSIENNKYKLEETRPNLLNDEAGSSRNDLGRRDQNSDYYNAGKRNGEVESDVSYPGEAEFANVNDAIVNGLKEVRAFSEKDAPRLAQQAQEKAELSQRILIDIDNIENVTEDEWEGGFFDNEKIKKTMEEKQLSRAEAEKIVYDTYQMKEACMRCNTTENVRLDERTQTVFCDKCTAVDFLKRNPDIPEDAEAIDIDSDDEQVDLLEEARYNKQKNTNDIPLSPAKTVYPVLDKASKLLPKVSVLFAPDQNLDLQISSGKAMLNTIERYEDDEKNVKEAIEYHEAQLSEEPSKDRRKDIRRSLSNYEQKSDITKRYRDEAVRSYYKQVVKILALINDDQTKLGLRVIETKQSEVLDGASSSEDKISILTQLDQKLLRLSNLQERYKAIQNSLESAYKFLVAPANKRRFDPSLKQDILRRTAPLTLTAYSKKQSGTRSGEIIEILDDEGDTSDRRKRKRSEGASPVSPPRSKLATYETKGVSGPPTNRSSQPPPYRTYEVIPGVDEERLLKLNPQKDSSGFRRTNEVNWVNESKKNDDCLWSFTIAKKYVESAYRISSAAIRPNELAARTYQSIKQQVDTYFNEIGINREENPPTLQSATLHVVLPTTQEYDDSIKQLTAGSSKEFTVVVPLSDEDTVPIMRFRKSKETIYLKRGEIYCFKNDVVRFLLPLKKESTRKKKSLQQQKEVIYATFLYAIQ